MATDIRTQLLTLEDFLEIERNAPEGARYALIDGQLREYSNTTTRSFPHSIAMSLISHFLWDWLLSHPQFPGTIAGGEARCRLTRNPDKIVGFDVAYFPQHTPAGKVPRLIEGPPAVAVEVLSGSDRHEEVVERIELLLNAGVKTVWVADPDLRTITTHRADAPPRMFTREQEPPGDPEMPGFRCRVESLFARTR